MSKSMRDFVDGEAELDDEDDESMDEDAEPVSRRRNVAPEDSSEEEEDDDDEEEARKVGRTQRRAIEPVTNPSFSKDSRRFHRRRG